MRIPLGAALTATAVLACTPPGARVDLQPGFEEEDRARAEAWQRYARARSEGPPIAEHWPSLDPPPFEQEVYARRFLARVWRELAEKRGYRDDYLDALAEVEAADYLREYTWQCLHVLRGLEPDDLRMDEFRSWFARELPEHRVETWVSARREGDTIVYDLGRRAHAPYACEATPPGSVGG